MPEPTIGVWVGCCIPPELWLPSGIVKRNFDSTHPTLPPEFRARQTHDPVGPGKGIEVNGKFFTPRTSDWKAFGSSALILLINVIVVT